MLVSVLSPHIHSERAITRYLALDFMTVRKIPIKEHPYLLADGTAATEEERVDSEDAEVPSFLTRIRTTLLSDRAIHDLVTDFIYMFLFKLIYAL